MKCNTLICWLSGSKSVDDLRAKLQQAMKTKDKTMLSKAISECVALGMPELDEDIHQARRVANILHGGTGG